MGTTDNTMNWTVLLSALLSVGLTDKAKDVSSPVIYAGYPYTGASLGYGYTGLGYGYAGLPYSGYSGLPYAGYAGYPYAVAAPAKFEVKTVEAPTLPAVTYAAAPALPYAAAAAPALAYADTRVAAAPYSTGSQFHAQDEFGNLNYGYTNINSAKQEVGNTYGGVSGGYSYVDANGELQQVQYIADGAGFRVADSRLPVAPVYDEMASAFNPEPLVAPTFNPELPVAPVDTPEVAEAKAAHLAAVAEAEAAAADSAKRKRREANPGFAYGFGTVHPRHAYGYAGISYAAGLPYSAGYGYAGLGYGLPYYG